MSIIAASNIARFFIKYKAAQYANDAMRKTYSNLFVIAFLSEKVYLC